MNTDFRILALVAGSPNPVLINYSFSKLGANPRKVTFKITIKELALITALVGTMYVGIMIFHLPFFYLVKKETYIETTLLSLTVTALIGMHF